MALSWDWKGKVWPNLIKALDFEFKVELILQSPVLESKCQFRVKTHCCAWVRLDNLHEFASHEPNIYAAFHPVYLGSKVLNFRKHKWCESNCCPLAPGTDLDLSLPFPIL